MNDSRGLVLVVEDETDIASTLKYALEREGYRTRVAHNGEDGLAQALRAPQPDLVVLDLMLPDISGTEVLRRLRNVDETRDIGVLILSARSDEIDRVVGFEVGADDYVGKPFSTRELMLRVRALLRRARPEAVARDQEENFGDLRIDPGAHRVWVQNEEIELTALEFKLLSTFLARRGRVQTRDVLLTDVWGISGETRTRTVDTHVKRLREKLGPAAAYVETVRGVGYRFAARPQRIHAA
jgi:two-component system phosphate regulon response regulator PhoB